MRREIAFVSHPEFS